MAVSVKAGFMGYVEVDGILIRCTDYNLKLTQEASFYDHIIGLRDTIPTDILGAKGDSGTTGSAGNEQKIFWRATTKIVEGTVSYPLAELSANAFYDAAYTGDWLSDVNVYYSCETGKTFNLCKVNTYSFNATAGEGANISVGLMGAYVEDAGAPPIYDTPEKLITFDEIEIIGTGADDRIVSFEFNINNNCMPIYTAGTNLGVGGVTGGISNLVVNDIRVGMQTLSGSITFYNDAGPADDFVETDTPVTIGITAGTFSATLNVLLWYPERQGATSAYVRTVTFGGVEVAVM